jgi:hypothetical protein
MNRVRVARPAAERPENDFEKLAVALDAIRVQLKSVGDGLVGDHSRRLGGQQSQEPGHLVEFECIGDVAKVAVGGRIGVVLVPAITSAPAPSTGSFEEGCQLEVIALLTLICHRTGSPPPDTSHLLSA